MTAKTSHAVAIYDYCNIEMLLFYLKTYCIFYHLWLEMLLFCIITDKLCILWLTVNHTAYWMWSPLIALHIFNLSKHNVHSYIQIDFIVWSTDLSVQAAARIMSVPKFDALKLMRDLSQNFPSKARSENSSYFLFLADWLTHLVPFQYPVF